MVESLDIGDRLVSLGGDQIQSGPMSAVAEQFMATRVDNMTMNSPVQSIQPVLPATAPDPPWQRSLSAQTRQTIAEETRSMLLSGMSPTQANDLGSVANRRLSAPADVTQEKRRQSLLLLRTDKLQAWGHVYLGDPSKADVFVAPAALRRLSGTDNVEDNGQSDRLVIRARVRPKDKERKPFVLSRSFNLSELRATLPSPSTSTSVASPRRQSAAPSSPDTASSSPGFLATSPSSMGRRDSSLDTSSPLLGRRGSHQPKGNSKEMPIRKSINVFLSSNVAC